MNEFTVSTSRKVEVVDITDQVADKISKDANAVLVYVPHATAAIVINEFEPNIAKDMEEYFGKLSSRKPGTGDWAHDQIDDNAGSHLGSATLGPSAFIPIENGEMQLGTWQRIILVDLDGPRTRRIIVSML
jgi:secondary thiamine-phosphate synthase enzyme